MKKLFAFFLAMVLMLCAVGCQSPITSESDIDSEGTTNSNNAANSENDMNFEIDPNLESDIIKAYMEYVNYNASDSQYWSEDDVSVDSYGTYNGCTVGYINGPFFYTQAHTGEKVGSYIFQYSDGQQMKAYKDGQFKSMTEAYKLGWLDKDAVAQILEKHKQAHPFLYG